MPTNGSPSLQSLLKQPLDVGSPMPAPILYQCIMLGDTQPSRMRQQQLPPPNRGRGLNGFLFWQDCACRGLVIYRMPTVLLAQSCACLKISWLSMLFHCHGAKRNQEVDCAELWCDFCLLQAKAQNLASICASLLDTAPKQQGVFSRAAEDSNLIASANVHTSPLPTEESISPAALSCPYSWWKGHADPSDNISSSRNSGARILLHRPSVRLSQV